MVAVAPFLEVVCKPLSDGLPTADWSFVGDKNRVLRASLHFLCSAPSCWRSCSLRVGSFCWAKVGIAKLIANPTRGTAKRIFIVSSRCLDIACRRNDPLRNFLQSPATSVSPMAERSTIAGRPYEWTPRPIPRQSETFDFLESTTFSCTLNPSQILAPPARGVNKTLSDEPRSLQTIQPSFPKSLANASGLLESC
jgi:hypothetical protein